MPEAEEEEEGEEEGQGVSAAGLLLPVAVVVRVEWQLQAGQERRLAAEASAVAVPERLWRERSQRAA